jgi:hypothetical protein
LKKVYVFSAKLNSLIRIANKFHNSSNFAELIREGKPARYMCSPKANFGKKPRDVYVIALRLCLDEWRRRHPREGANHGI